MTDEFQRWIITLGAQVHALYGSISSSKVEQLTKEMKAYEAELQQLYLYAGQNNIKLINYYYSFAEIEAHLLLTYKHLKDIKTGASK